jgi:hypothetical protein
MLSPGAGDITVTLSKNIAALLEPPDANRMGAMDFVKKMYNVRSKVLHGASLDFDPRTIHKCRFLAAAVLRAFVERRGHAIQKAGKAEDPSAFFDALQNAQMNGKTIEGVSESPVRGFWQVQQ